MAEMVQGQLYRVGMTCIAPNERCEVELLVVAANNEDAKAKLPWVYDLSDFSSYRVDFTVKEPGRCAVLKQAFKRTPENEPDINVQRPDGTQPHFQKVPSEVVGKKWSVIARTVCYAKDGHSAVKKLSKRIESGSDFVQWASEELAESSPYATARDTSVFPAASFVRG